MSLPWYPAEVLARLSPPPPSLKEESEDYPFGPNSSPRPSQAAEEAPSLCVTAGPSDCSSPSVDFPVFELIHLVESGTPLSPSPSRNSAPEGAANDYYKNPKLGFDAYHYPPESPPPVMLRPRALASLFDANVDKDSKGIFMCTHNGLILAHSSSLPAQKFKDASALGALTFKIEATITRDETWYGPAKPLRTIFKKVKGDVLKALVVEMNGEILCLADVREHLLAGVFGHKIDGVGDGSEKGEEAAATSSTEVIAEGSVTAKLDKELSDKFAQAVGVGKDNETKPTRAVDEATGKGPEAAEVKDTAKGEDKDIGEGSDQEQEGTNTGKGKAKAVADDNEQGPDIKGEESATTHPEGSGHARTRPEDHPVYGAALLKAQGMAAWLRRDLKDFKMPTGFY